MLNWFRGVRLEDHLNKSKRIRIFGIKFRIKKINPMDHLDGSNAALQFHETYKLGGEKSSSDNLKKLKKHYADVFMSAVIEPKLKRKDDYSEGLFIDNLFTDWALANRLYESIFKYTYGKKKV